MLNYVIIFVKQILHFVELNSWSLHFSKLFGNIKNIDLISPIYLTIELIQITEYFISLSNLVTSWVNNKFISYIFFLVLFLNIEN